MSLIDPSTKVNLTKAEVLLLDGSTHSLEVTAQMFRGFGTASVNRCDSVSDAEEFLQRKSIDLIVIDPAISDGGGYAFLQKLRQSDSPNAHVPIIMMCGYVRAMDVARGRDTGANFVVAKPVSPSVLLQRVLWVAKDKRPFVEVGNYVGPDRRFKFQGPPAGSDGRRSTDLSEPLGEAGAPNMSQDEIDTFIKPQRVQI